MKHQLEFASLNIKSNAKLNRKSSGNKTMRIKGFEKPKLSFGGKLLKGNNPKHKRPLESKLPIHLVLTAAQGGMRLPKTFGAIEAIIANAARRHGIKIYKQANVGNHLHFLLKITSRRLWRRFIRELTGRIAQLLKDLGVAPKDRKFWLVRPFTRIVNGWRKAFEIAKEYVGLNQLEAEGFISRKDIKTLKDLRAIWADT